MRMHRFALAAVFCAAVLAPSALGAQTYPSKPLHLILPYVPGGIIDTAGRNLALRLSEAYRWCRRILRAPLPVKTLAEFIAYAKANPGKLNFASAGVGTAPHLAGEMIKLAAGIEMTHVPYRGIGAAYPDVMSGKVQLAF
ncbi:MAG: hypothetical protein E6G75_13490, partial [Alphaproteobacteria bacterium]